MKIDEALSPSLNGLEFAQNTHLFQWSGVLLYGDGDTITTADPEVVPEKDIADFRYHQRTHSIGYVDRSAPGEIGSATFAHVMRQKLEPVVPRATHNQAEHVAPSFTRPSRAVAFELRQQQYQVVDNPLILELGLAAFIENFRQTPQENRSAYLDGCQWVLDSVSQSILDLKLIPRSLIETLGDCASMDALWMHCLAKKPLELVEAVIDQFQQNDYTQMRRAVDEKLKLTAIEAERWADAGKIPVTTDAGDVDRVLCLANMATSLVALQKLWRIRCEVWSFGRGAIAVTEQLLSKLES